MPDTRSLTRASERAQHLLPARLSNFNHVEEEERVEREDGRGPRTEWHYYDSDEQATFDLTPPLVIRFRRVRDRYRPRPLTVAWLWSDEELLSSSMKVKSLGPSGIRANTHVLLHGIQSHH